MREFSAIGAAAYRGGRRRDYSPLGSGREREGRLLERWLRVERGGGVLGSPSALAFAGELGRVPEPEPARLPEPLRDPDPERELRRGFAGCDPAS
ncbi:MAG: hypothetical protein ABW249_10430, partial [Solirubrobacterales bacterium]